MGGSSSTTKTVQENKIPAYLTEASKLAVEEAKKIKEMGYLPYFGPEIAALNPYEQARAQNVGGMAAAFGLSAPAVMDMSGVDTATSGGVTGYTTAPAYFSALERLKELRPDQYEYFANLGRFDPITGAVNPNYVAPAKSTPSYSGGSSGRLFSAISSGGGDDGPNMRKIMADRVAESKRRSQSGGFDPLGPSGNISLDFSGLFGG